MRSSERVYDELLVTLVQSGDRWTLERLVARWQPRLLRSARRFTGDVELAREAVQESGIGIFAGLSKLKDATHFPSGAFAILRRRCADKINATTKHRPRSDELTEANEPSSTPQPDNGIAINQAFAKLGANQRIAATLFFVEHMTEFDDKIRGALDADDEAFLRELGQERGMFAQVGDTLTGPLGGWAKLVFVIAFLMAMVMFYTVYQIIVADTDREFFAWGMGAFAAFYATSTIKQWFFDRMNLITVMRKSKRIELRIAGLEERG